MPYCRKCGEEIKADAKMCPFCSAPQTGRNRHDSPSRKTSHRPDRQQGKRQYGGQSPQDHFRESPPPEQSGEAPAHGQGGQHPPREGQGRQPPPQRGGPPQDGDDGRSALFWVAIGVVGIVAVIPVAVILAAVIAAFVLGLGDSSVVGPSVSFDYEYQGEDTTGPGQGELTITVASGDGFSASSVRFEGENLGGAEGTRWYEQAPDSDIGPDDTVTAGDQLVLTGLSDDFELDIVWTAEDGSDTSIIASRSGPDA